LPRDLGPGYSVTLRATIQALEKAGEYLLHLTLFRKQSHGFQTAMVATS
jgi:hypothetical protein